MALINVLHQGPVTVIDYRCTSGPLDAPFAEIHPAHSISYVRKGAFGCEWRGRSLEFVPGSLFIGHPGDEYVCSHSHHRGGDECLSFQYAPEVVDEVAPRARWRVGAVPAIPEVVVLGEKAQAAARDRCAIALEEIGLLLASRFACTMEGRVRHSRRLRATERRRAIESALWLDAHAHEPIELADAAHRAGLSSYHYLRSFAAVLGVTPYQYIVRSRLRSAARLLTGSAMPVTDIALEAGFNDVSNFVRTFARAAGMAPGEFRRCAHRRSNFLQADRSSRS
jgi:AraC family transcriptional regulator